MLTIQSFLLKVRKLQVSKNLKKNVKYASLMFAYVFVAIFVVLKFNVFQLNQDHKTLEAFAAQNITNQTEGTVALNEVELLGRALNDATALNYATSPITLMSADIYAGDLVSGVTSAKNNNDTSTSKEQEEVVSTTKSKKDESATKKEVAQDAKETMNSDVAVLSLSTKEIGILERIVEAEATGEDIKGKILVANVIMNRVNDSSFPDTVEEVVFQKTGGTYQFSPISDKRYYSVAISDETKEAVQRVLHGEDYSQGALYFSARKRASAANMKWFDSKLKRLFQYGGHEFFTHK